MAAELTSIARTTGGGEADEAGRADGAAGRVARRAVDAVHERGTGVGVVRRGVDVVVTGVAKSCRASRSHRDRLRVGAHREDLLGLRGGGVVLGGGGVDVDRAELPAAVKLTRPVAPTVQPAELLAVPSTLYMSVAPGSVSFVEALTL